MATNTSNAVPTGQFTEPDFLPDVGKTLGSLIPTAVSKAVTPAFTTLAPRQQITVSYLTADASDRQRRAVMTCMTLCGRCTDTRPAAWQSWVLTWSCLCFPELVQQFKDDTTAVDYKYEALPPDFIESCVSAAMAQATPETAGDQFVSFPGHLPNAGATPVNPELVAACTMEGLYTYYAMVVFVMGKSLSVENIKALSFNRPDALIRKRQLHGCAFILTGDGKVHSDNYKHVQGGWVRSTRPRITVVKHLARMAAAQGRSEILDTINVNMELLRNASQTYLFYIHELLVACPWALRLPALRAPYYHYVKMVNVMTEQEEWFRPYYKLAYQDAAKVVRRREIEPLIAVATFHAAQTRKSMNQYKINEGTLQVVQAFRALALTMGYVFADVPNQATTDTIAV